jgi:perosamine synthetase
MLILKAPNPRFRVYTRLSDYWLVFRDLLTGRARKGDDVERLESEVSKRFDVPYAVAMPQCRVGIYLAIKAVILPGQKVICSPYTISDVINMVVCAGGVPVFADIEEATGNIDANEVEKLIDADTGAVLVTHLHGIPCAIERIQAICKTRGVPLLEDAAQSFGATVNGKRLGTFGDVGIFSFGMYKNINCFYGGMVVTHRKDVHDRIRAERDTFPYQPTGHFLDRVIKALRTDLFTWPPIFHLLTYWIFRYGHLHGIGWINKIVTVELDLTRKDTISSSYLCRLLPLQARIVLRQLDDIDPNSEIRIRYSRLYHEGLSGIPQLILPPFKDDGSHIYNYFPIQYNDRTALVRWTMQNARDMAIQHLKNCAALPAFARESRPCPRADLVAARLIILPNYPRYSERDVRRNIEVIQAFFRK